MTDTGYTDSGDQQREPNPVAATLRAARAQIADPARWAKGYWAYDALGEQADPRSPAACCWCALGALNAVTPVVCGPRTDAIALLDRLAAERQGKAAGATMPIFAYNDAPTTTHADVLALFDRAIAAAEQEAPHE